MNKKTLKIILSALAVVMVAGISVGAVMKLRASDDSAYKKMVLAKDTFEINGVRLYYVEPDEEMQKRYPDSIIYRDDNNQNYYFDADTQELYMIENRASYDKEYTNLIAENIKPYEDTETLFKDAKERIGKWYDGDIEKFEWENKTDDLGQTRFKMLQALNDEFSVHLASAVYDMDGDISYITLNFEAMVNLNKKKDFLSKEEAIEKAKAFLEEEYGETDWEEITANDMTNKTQLYWGIDFKKDSEIVAGYYVKVDLLTGEVSMAGTFR